MQLRCIDFFAGIGAWEIAIDRANKCLPLIKFKTVEFVEKNPDAQKVLRLHFPDVPIWDDVRSYQPELEADVFLVSFPCTGTSLAGKKEGLDHEESRLWFEVLRCIATSKAKPKFIVVEQPLGFIYQGLRAVLGGLRVGGYSSEIEVISAAEFGAPHERQRLFIVATDADYLPIGSGNGIACWSEQIGNHIKVARAIGWQPKTKSSSIGMDDGVPEWLDGISFDGYWREGIKPPLAAGIAKYTPGRRECVNLYGRSIVPQQALIPLMRVQYLARKLKVK